MTETNGVQKKMSHAATEDDTTYMELNIGHKTQLVGREGAGIKTKDCAIRYFNCMPFAKRRMGIYADDFVGLGGMTGDQNDDKKKNKDTTDTILANEDQNHAQNSY